MKCWKKFKDIEEKFRNFMYKMKEQNFLTEYIIEKRKENTEASNKFLY